MLQMLCGVVALVLIAVSSASWSVPPQYTVDALIELPYAGIREPVSVYYDGASKKSLTSSYLGTDRYFYRGDIGSHGTLFQINPVSNSTVKNVMSCFTTVGDSDGPIEPVSIFPDMSDYKLSGNATVRGIDCDDYMYTYQMGPRTNTYHLYVSRASQMPIQFHMLGYDDLLGSHYDEYVINYLTVQNTVDNSVFNTPSDVPCGNFPGPGLNHQGPLSIVHDHEKDEKNIAQHWEEFKSSFKKQYESEHDHSSRMHNFRHNKRFIENHNRKGKSFKVAINHLADLHDHEIKKMRGSFSTRPFNMKTAEFDVSGVPNDLPTSVDWRQKGAVTPVKDQGICGSCWSFGSAQAIEGQIFLQHGKLIPISQQSLMDCSWGHGNNACDGGEAFRAYDWVLENGGIPTAASYGPYLMADGYCHPETATVGAKLAGYVNISSSINDVLTNIANKGPVAVAIDASHKSFSFYSEGVYYEEECGNTPDDLDHAVLAVGYGTDANGDDYWIVKNSWSSHWGNNGFVLMSRKENNCGVATDAHMPIIV